ncbi:MAG: type II secretion system F family protein [Betaproteobacteria bacterium]
MPQFAYQGRNSRGELVKGVLEGASSGAVADQLFSTGITPVHINEASGAAAAAAGAGAGKRLEIRFGEPGVELADLMLFSRQMHTLLKSGVPIIRALAGLQESSQNPTLARVVGEVREALESGRELSIALRAHPKVFSGFMVNMVRVGEMTGRLDEVFLRLYEFFAFEKKMREDIRAALRYPMIVIGALAVAMFIVNIFVIPAFARMFASFKAELPLMTRVLIASSDAFVAWWWLMLIGLAAAAVGFRLYTQTPKGRYGWDWLKLRLPVIGGLIHKATLARFSRSFALAGKSGVPIVQALALVAEVVDNAYLEARILQMRDGIERGESILRTAVATGVFDPVVLQMVAVGEETGEIDELMAEIADMYEREVTIEVEGLTAKLEPILLVFVGILVLILALGVFLPRWDMASAARGGGGAR